MDQAQAKKELNALIDKLDLGNKTCCDCENKNPQWASLSHATFICLECAGQHRGFGVHISFYGYVARGTNPKDESGGNAAFQEFVKQYPHEDVGGFTRASTLYEKYHSWTAKQYREKLDAELKGESWSPSLPPADWNAPTSPGTSRPSSAQGLRKSKMSGRATQGSSLRRETSSPSSFSNSNSPPPTTGGTNGSTSPLVDDQKARNEAYFATLGAANAARSSDLPPSQGGRYTGFGNTPSPDSNSSHPSYGLSSRNAPTLSDFQDDPGAALSKGWSLFSSVLAGATKTVHESVIQPGLERVRDPSFQSNVRGYVDEAGRRVGAVGSHANQWGKSQFGVDVVDSMAGVYDNIRDKVGGPSAPAGYGRLDQTHGSQGFEPYNDREDDFFNEFNANDRYDDATHATAGNSTGSGFGLASNNTTSSNSTSTNTNTAKKNDWDDEWKDF